MVPNMFCLSFLIADRDRWVTMRPAPSGALKALVTNLVSSSEHLKAGVAVEFRILGPLEVLDDHGQPLILGGAKQRALLAVLLLHAGQVVSANRLIDELWGEDPPETVRSVLQVYVANLRKALEPARSKRAASSLLRTQPPGYLLDLDPEELDLARFERLAGEGRAALAAGDPARAAWLLHEAQGLWRGSALLDVTWLPAAKARSSGSRSAVWPSWRTGSRLSLPWATMPSWSVKSGRWWRPIRCGSDSTAS
jgi:DNA-binding winged helix-turn-helix (wHTH) protein